MVRFLRYLVFIPISMVVVSLIFAWPTIIGINMEKGIGWTVAGTGIMLIAWFWFGKDASTKFLFAVNFISPGKRFAAWVNGIWTFFATLNTLVEIWTADALGGWNILFKIIVTLFTLRLAAHILMLGTFIIEEGEESHEPLIKE